MVRQRIAVFVGWVLAGGTAVAGFADANSSFESGKYDEAVTAYRQLIEQDALHQPAVFFNLGNAEYRRGNRGEAALAYARALAVDPTYVEARQNLGFLERKTGLLAFEKESSPALQKLSRNEAITLLAGAIWLLSLALGALLFLRPKGAKRGVSLGLFGMGVVAAVYAGLCIYWIKQVTPPANVAIVTDATASAHTDPARSADSIIALPEGSEIRVLSKRGSWSYVEIPGNLRGWVESDRIQSLWAFRETTEAQS